jgi:hypothetical protein
LFRPRGNKPRQKLRGCQLKKNAHGRELKQTQLKIKRCLLQLTAILADTRSIFFSNATA